MKVLLREDYKGLGEAGAVVKVKDGFARNFLIPQGIAYIATDQNQKRYENDLKQQSWRTERDKHKAEELAKTLENVSCTISVQVGEEDKLFGSVTAQNIADNLAEQGYKIDRRKIQLDEPIKSLGIYSVGIKLHQDVDASVKVWVVKE
ncbi:MAG: 50S ribosomal protein L9 [Calditrichae bacterium]|nr:50S ribosomal protein L9 [Calditrichota bacterium]MCB9058794.1 50S ribosomal protein L9 [Calditrichia bacterium]